MRHSFDPLIFAEIDGYFVYHLARSLPSLEANLDLPAYRAQRILLPFLAAPFGAFIPWAIISINLGALATGSYALACIALQYRLSPLIPMTIEDATCMSFRALRFAQGKRSEESERVAHDPLRCSG
ncbi:MAG: hypothetical protein KatS3mg058_4639 [Roseiflexus sp.]|nr:MAG: hypothetical protein KatS3mg058_4639 [Roseiflexus sp.]